MRAHEHRIPRSASRAPGLEWALLCEQVFARFGHADQSAIHVLICHEKTLECDVG